MVVHQNSDQISIDVIETIASVTGTDPLEMDPPLYETIDTDALDTLYKRGADARIEFAYDGHTVVVEPDRTVTVDGREG